MDVNGPVCLQLQSIHENLFHVFVVSAVKLAGARSVSEVEYADGNLHLLKCDLIIQGRNPINDGQMHLGVWRSFVYACRLSGFYIVLNT